MKNLEVSLLRPGMIFSEPVYIDDTNILVLAGIPLRQKDIDNLIAWEIESVHTEGSAYLDKNEYAEIAIKKVASALSLSDVQENKGAYRSYTQLIEEMNMIFLNITARNSDKIDDSINVITTELLQLLREKRKRFVGFILGGEIKGNTMAKSSVNTAILSVLIALELKLPHYRIFNVAIGALLHDVGMLRIPKAITEKKGGLSEEEYQLMQNHPLAGHRIVTNELSYLDEVGDIVLQHHERWDGVGYPDQRSGSRINLGARIVSIADSFEAMISEKSYRNSMAGYQAMINLLSESAQHFDPNVLKAFVVAMGIYPIGSFVSLNNGIVARVIDVRANAPLRPRIQVVIDEFKTMHKNEAGMIIDLLVEKDLFITEAMDAKELSIQYA